MIVLLAIVIQAARSTITIWPYRIQATISQSLTQPSNRIQGSNKSLLHCLWMKQLNKLWEVLGSLSSCKPSSFQFPLSLMHNKHLSASIPMLSQNGTATSAQHATGAKSQKVIGLGMNILRRQLYQTGASNVLVHS